MDLPPNFRLLVIGVGQEFRGDDAAGLLIARRLREMLGPEVAILEKSGAAGDLLAAWQGADAVILADAVRGGGPPGKIYRFPVHEAALPAELFPAASTHAWGVAQAVALGQVLRQLPPFLVVYGIEGRDFGLGQNTLSGGGPGHPGGGPADQAGKLKSLLNRKEAM